MTQHIAAQNHPPGDECSSRYFEFVEGKSSKFWEVFARGCEVTTRWGRIGTNGQTKSKTLVSAEQAQAERDKLIQQKLAKGYVERLSRIRAVAEPEVTEEPQAVEKEASPLQTPADSINATDVSASEIAAPTLSPADADQLVWDFADQYRASLFHLSGQPERVPVGERILSLAPIDQVAIVLSCIREHKAVCKQTRHDTLWDLLERLLGIMLPYSTSDVELLCSALCVRVAEDGPSSRFAHAIKTASHGVELTDKAKHLLCRSRDRIDDGELLPDVNLRNQINQLLDEAETHIPLGKREMWTRAAIEDLTAANTNDRAAWIRLLKHCATAKSSKPDEAWNQAASEYLHLISEREFDQKLASWIPLVDKARDVFLGNPLILSNSSQNILRGLIWCCAIRPSESLARTVMLAAVLAYKSIPRVGSRSTKLGNACVNTLAQMPEHGGVSQLASLKLKVRQKNAKNLIDKQLARLSEELDLPADQIEEMCVPTHGMTDVGARIESVGDFVCELRHSSGSVVELHWIKSDGEQQKSVPASVKRDHGKQLKDLKAAAKEISKMIPVQRERIDRLFLEQRTWPFGVWRERYLDHPLVGTIARRLIWRFQTGEKVEVGIHLDGQLVGADNQPLELTEETSVDLWHPIGHTNDQILAWRSWIEEHQVQQPFKQAHREIYLVTDAERTTGVYSNRFAAHILRQSQFRALAATRGWTTELLGPWDGGDVGIARKQLPAWNMQAEYWIMSAGEDYGEGAGSTFVSTDQVRFYAPAEVNEPIAIANVPPLVFSEVMRDVDLFVGVASVGNDPHWVDGGEGQHYYDYWQQFSFGDLSATAKTRRNVLEQLVPRLKIADQCSLSDKFLVVRGQLRTYKIHLGSSSILMEPNNEYLCIVPDRRQRATSDKVYLPFEGDTTLSIILSKAFLLADDQNISDPTIINQIGIET